MVQYGFIKEGILPWVMMKVLMSVVRRESESVWKSDEGLANPIVTFPIKKKINTGLFINGKHKIYILSNGSIGFY